MALLNTSFSNEEINNLLKKSKRIFFIGIGGVSMSTLATYMHFKGYKIYGYDKERSGTSQKLESIAEELKKWENFT